MNSKRAKRVERGEVERREVGKGEREREREIVRMVRVLGCKPKSGERRGKGKERIAVGGRKEVESEDKSLLFWNVARVGRQEM